MPVAARAWMLILFLFSAATASAQFDTASIVGAVRDTTGASVPGATVTLTNTATGVSAAKTTGEQGGYEFFAVKAGTYVVSAERSGFAVALVDNVQVQVGARLRVDLQMTVGQVAERVEVTAAAPLIETDSSQRGQVITGDQMRQLAINGREYSFSSAAYSAVPSSRTRRSSSATTKASGRTGN